MSRSISIGITSGMLGPSFSLEEAGRLPIDTIELYNYHAEHQDKIEAFFGKADVEPSIHVPMPPNPAQRRFCPTGPDEVEATTALEQTLATIAYAKHHGGRHVVIHFPTPYEKYEEHIPEDRIKRFLDPVGEVAEQLGVEVLLENLTACSCFHEPEHYADLLKRYPAFRFCLDLGHAHLLSPECAIKEFIDCLGTRISSCHTYNTTILRYASYGHEIPLPHQRPDRKSVV